ncbi:arf-GAP with Rho-GAP domain, ANK repeat and PH domain-containing protein 1-like isoform X2 [Anneissia japonica]|uniref:arf-GAP with Rho-GAP domain, ANK repeat and PH domain-containing protein 1-like isoform X2 n=1 Tax=Anneissia japonica TaxID=1529436 RepID=UPI001425A9FA|nr:arf-GAP with Rho-GAP domain, ANK repeat and PH domain-containing protein 1-like isoform X2 [Anneissia japonica]
MENNSPASLEEWLISIKMEEYTGLFKLNELRSVKQLQELDEDTLLHMGVQMRGHRKRILMHRPNTEFRDNVASASVLNDNDFLIDFHEKPKPPEIPPRIVPQIPPRPAERSSAPEPVPRSLRPVPIPGGVRPVSSIAAITSDSHLKERPVPQPRKLKPAPVTNGNHQDQTTVHTDHPIPAERRLPPPPLPEKQIIEEIDHPQPPPTPPVDLRTRPVPTPPPAQPLPTLPPRPYSQFSVNAPPKPREETNFVFSNLPSLHEQSRTDGTQDVWNGNNFSQSLDELLTSDEYSVITYPPVGSSGNTSGMTSKKHSSDLIKFDEHMDNEDPYDRLWESNDNIIATIPALPEIETDPLNVYSDIEFSSEPPLPIHPPPPPPPSPPSNDNHLVLSDIDSEEDPEVNQDSITPKVVREGTLKRFQETLNGKATTNEKSGILSKQGGQQGKRGVQKRFVKFDGKYLKYYENEKKTCFSKKMIPVGAMRDVEVNQATSALKNNTLSLRTTNRVYVFLHENMDVLISWSLTLMKAIVECPKVEYPIGGEMNSPDKEGYMKVDETRLYVALKHGILCYYKNKADFDAGTPITDVCMNTASCRELPKNKIQLHTPFKTFMFTLESPEEVAEWLNAIKEMIDEALADRTVLRTIQQNVENKFCADCGMPEPDWSAVNFGVIICKKCSGAHRKLQFNVPKVRSVKMDINIWTPALQEIMVSIGNKINDFWEGRLNDYKKPKPDDSIEVRKEFIERKYQYRMFCKKHPVMEYSGQEGMDKEVCRIASSPDNLYEAMVLLFSGAKCRDVYPEAGVSALEIAIHANAKCIVEIFNLNKDSDFTTQRPPPRINSVPVADAPSMPLPSKRNSEEQTKAGYLFKTGVGRKEFQRRYCRLENGTFTYSVDEKSPIVKNTIEGIDILMIGNCQPRPGYEHCFEMGVTSGRTYLFCAESAEDKHDWMYIIAKFLTPKVMWSYLDSFDLAGHLHMKEGITSTTWRRLTFLLSGKKLSYFSAEKDSMADLDLRKLSKSYVVTVEDVKLTSTEQTICVCFPDKSLYLRSENKENSDRWHTAIQSTLYESGTSLENQQLTKDNIPVVVSECISFVEKNGLKTEGIYRLAGVKSKANQILQNLYYNARDVRLTLDEDYMIHDVTSALKQYFRELDDPLLTSDLYQRWVRCSACPDNARKIREYSDLVKGLPEVNKCTLKELINHLRDVSDNKDENKMEVKNLAAVFGPTLMSGKNAAGGFGAANYEISVIGDLMLNYSEIFDVTQEEKDKKMKQKEFMHKLTAFSGSGNGTPSNFVHMTLYIGPKSENDSIDVQMSEIMTAGELIQSLIDSNKINMPPSQVSVFEVICNGELERVFNPKEEILPEIYRWDERMRTENYICIKANSLERKIEKYLTLSNASSNVTFFDGKRKIKKAYLDVSGFVLKCSKDKRNIYSSRVSDIVFYFGVEKKKSAKFGFTFIDRKDDSAILRAVLVETEEDVYYWLGCLLNTKRQCSESSNNNFRSPPVPASRGRSPFRESLGSMFQQFAAELKEKAQKITSKRRSKLRYTYRRNQTTRRNTSAVDGNPPIRHGPSDLHTPSAIQENVTR